MINSTFIFFQQKADPSGKISGTSYVASLIIGNHKNLRFLQIPNDRIKKVFFPGLIAHHPHGSYNQGTLASLSPNLLFPFELRFPVYRKGVGAIPFRIGSPLPVENITR
jgi:hypothetical protein